MRRALRPAVYWFWSSIPTRADAERQAAEIAAAGFGAVMIQARLSFPRAEYLSPDYLAGYRVAAEAAIAAGLEVVVYDDYNWASGHAGGRTVAGAAGDPVRERHLVWSTAGPGRRTATVSQLASPWFDGLGEAGTRWIYEDGVRRFDEWALVAAVAHPGTGATPFGARRDEPRDVTRWAVCEGDDDGCAFTLADDAPLPDGWSVSFYASARCASSRLIDYLDPAAARRFVEVTHEPYARALDGLPVTAFSFDHPYAGFYTWREHDGLVGNSLMWNPVLGSSPTLLHAVIHDAGPRGRRARCRFFAAYAARGIDSFFGTLADWTREHGYGLTGHELLAHVGGWSLHDGFAELDARTNFGADHFAIDRHRSQTLVDAMGSDPQLSPRFGDSVARASAAATTGGADTPVGRDRCTVELYYTRRDPPEDFAAGEWELTLPQLRRAALRLHLLGARRFLFHAYHQTDGRDGDPELLSNPRFDFPPAINFEPWFAWFGALAEESARLSAFIEGAEPIRDVALVYPLATVWADGPGHPHGRRFGEWAEVLARAGVGFDVIDDRALDAGVVRDGRLSIPASGHVAAGPDAPGYAAVVLPGAVTLPSPRTLETLEALAAAGGTVVATAPLPDLTAAEGPDAGLAARVAAASAIPASDTVPVTVPGVLRRADTGPVWTLGDGEGTVWRWTGRAEEGVRVALFNEGPVTRELRLATACGEPGVADTGAPATIALEPDELACLTLTAGAGLSRPGAHNCPRVPGPARTDGASRLLADGWTLSVEDGPAMSIDPSIGWECQGHATFAGLGTYRCAFDLAAEIAEDLAADPDAEWTLELPVVHCAAAVTLNGVALGERGWPPYRFAIASGTLRATDNRLQVAVANAAANRYYAGTRFAIAPQPSGLGAAPRLGRS